jgi:hypothetical protein
MCCITVLGIRIHRIHMFLGHPEPFVRGTVRLKIMCLRISYKKKNMKTFFFASSKSLKKGVGCGVGYGSIGQRCGSADPDAHQNVTDPQHTAVP